MNDWTIRDARTEDHDAIRRINAANEPEVGPLDDDRLALFAAGAARFQVVVTGGEPLGVFVGLPEGVAYSSPNYRWFTERHSRFAYVDRIAIEPTLRGRGCADALYESFEAWGRETGRPLVCAEVNTVPANPRSLRFHQRRGFDVVAETSPYGGEERVAMLVKQL